MILGSLGRWLDRILSSRHPFTKYQYPVTCLESIMIQQSEALRHSLTMADSSFDETVDNNPVILKMEARHDSSFILMSMPSIASLYRFFPSPFFQRERLVASPMESKHYPKDGKYICLSETDNHSIIGSNTNEILTWMRLCKDTTYIFSFSRIYLIIW